ncbi:hypothetical protein ON010_g2354 [Phytophthora cinnamomi]|nr:hypothetical protein ON010_g2354 [Phytophthora cinnamomi]
MQFCKTQSNTEDRHGRTGSAIPEYAEGHSGVPGQSELLPQVHRGFPVVVVRDDDGLEAILSAGITPREHLDEITESLVPANGRVRRPPVISVEMLGGNFEGVVLSFDGAAKTSTGKGSCGCILWRLSGWDILDAQGFIPDEVTVNDAEYQGLLNGLIMALNRGVKDRIVVGDSRNVVQQLQGKFGLPDFQDVSTGHAMECRRWGRADAPAASVEDLLEADETCRSVVRRVIPDEILLDSESATLPPAARVMAVLTWAATQRQTELDAPMDPLEFQAERWRRIKAHRDQNEYLVELKATVTGDHEVVSMCFVTHMPKSKRGNTCLLLFQDTFSGYVMCKPMSSTTAQDVPEVYEERVFRSFGASSMIGHDQDPRFMGEVFTRFRELLGSKQRATLAYRPMANGQQERSVQTVIRSVRAYIAEADQSDWDDHAERLIFALNTSFDATRLDTPFYLVHGWGAQGTVSAILGPKPSSVPERTAIVQKKAKKERSEEQTRKWNELSDRLKSGFEKFDPVIDEIHDDFRVKLKIDNTGYRVNQWVHVSRLKPRVLFPRRPSMDIMLEEDDDFDAALLPEDSWEPEVLNDEYEVEKILDLQWAKRTRMSKHISKLNCGALLYEFKQGALARARLQSMQAGDDHPSV